MSEAKCIYLVACGEDPRIVATPTLPDVAEEDLPVDGSSVLALATSSDHAWWLASQYDAGEIQPDNATFHGRTIVALQGAMPEEPQSGYVVRLTEGNRHHPENICAFISVRGEVLWVSEKFATRFLTEAEAEEMIADCRLADETEFIAVDTPAVRGRPAGGLMDDQEAEAALREMWVMGE